MSQDNANKDKLPEAKPAPGPHGLGTPIAAPIVKPSDKRGGAKKPRPGSAPANRPAA